MMIYRQMPRVAAVRHVREHVLWLQFSDGVEGEINLREELRGELFEPLRDPVAFARVGIQYGTLAWPNGADWAPETLYDRVCATKGSSAHAIDDARRSDATYIASVPEISRFFGVVIRMLANDHAPPHFHAYYAEYEVTITIRDGVVTGTFPGRALRLVLEWRDLHGSELMANWDRLVAGQAPQPIVPLS
jgi:hypothetical protein